MFFDGPFFACLSPDGSIKSEHADVVVDVEAVVVLVEPDLGHGEGLLEHDKLRKFSLCPAQSGLLYSTVQEQEKSSNGSLYPLKCFFAAYLYFTRSDVKNYS